jgi:pimeloyl-ACP methyl ester carboxylesterase
VIVLPGITATGLEDFYPIPPEEVWTAVLRKQFERLALHPDDLRYEAREPARIQPRQPFGIVYQDLVEALRYDLSSRHDRPTPVFLFAYDWRQDCRITSAQLDAFIDEVLARTALLRHYRDAANRPYPNLRVDLVGHSMGGLIIADYLARRRAAARKKVRRVVSIGTPFQGSVDAVAKVSTGMGSFTDAPPRDREREAARTIPALYQLLPTFPGALDPDPGLPGDIFSVGTWQPSVVETLAEYIRQQKARIEAETLLARLLGAAREFRAKGDSLNLARVLPEGKDGWMAIVGMGAPTRQAARVIEYQGKPWFDFPEPTDRWSEDRRSAVTGDGTVAFSGACPKPSVLERERLVCVSPEEFELLEIRDRLLAKAAGFHAALPTVNLVQRLTIRFLNPRFDTDLRARPAPGVTKPVWPAALKIEVVR